MQVVVECLCWTRVTPHAALLPRPHTGSGFGKRGSSLAVAKVSSSSSSAARGSTAQAGKAAAITGRGGSASKSSGSTPTSSSTSINSTSSSGGSGVTAAVQAAQAQEVAVTGSNSKRRPHTRQVGRTILQHSTCCIRLGFRASHSRAVCVQTRPCVPPAALAVTLQPSSSIYLRWVCHPTHNCKSSTSRLPSTRQLCRWDWLVRPRAAVHLPGCHVSAARRCLAVHHCCDRVLRAIVTCMPIEFACLWFCRIRGCLTWVCLACLCRPAVPP